MTDAELRAGVNEFTMDDPPPDPAPKAPPPPNPTGAANRRRRTRRPRPRTPSSAAAPGGGAPAPDRSLELALVQLEESPEIVLPLTGQLVDLTKPLEAANALRDVRDLKRQLDEVRMLLEGVLRLEAARQGTKTLHLGPVDAVISGGPSADYDAELLVDRLRAAGLPNDRIIDAVTVIVSYKVDQRVLRQLASANPGYAAAIDSAKSTVEKPWRVSLKGVKP